jgi:aspartyl-tRNA(Asn)/glutamyl-tRNA(Gln) amidotransferase subunit B
MSQWETVIGLEIHVELNTRSKLFSVAPNRFGDEPNTNITEVCTGQPGALPVLNREAVRKAMQFGCAIQAEVAKWSQFDRKSYFYPDSPRNFQITQFEHPIVRGGVVVADVDGVPKEFAVDRAHLEDDAGMLKHFGSFAGVDYNRAGVPLLEIVSTPCMRSAREASAYAQAVRAIMLYIDASDCNMEEGSLRIDANVSVRPRGETRLRNKVEIKNINSFAFMEMALAAEIGRQIRLYEEQPDADPDTIIHRATFRWDGEKKQTVMMRRKESADDYRYFPDPDLVPVILTDAQIEEVRALLPELPYARQQRYTQQLQLTDDVARTLVSEKALSDYFEEGLKTTRHARQLANWITVEFQGRLKEKGLFLPTTGIRADQVAQLVEFIEAGTVTGKIAKSVADAMVAAPGTPPDAIIAANPDFQPLHDTGAIEQLVDQVLQENSQSVTDFRAGKEKAFAFLVGQVMKLSRGKAAPQQVNELLKRKLQQPQPK